MLSFPPDFPAEHKGAVLDAVGHCAVKEEVQQGPQVQFNCREGWARKPGPARWPLPHGEKVAARNRALKGRLRAAVSARGHDKHQTGVQAGGLRMKFARITDLVHRKAALVGL